MLSHFYLHIDWIKLWGNHRASPVRTVICQFTLDRNCEAALLPSRRPFLAFSRAPPPFIAKTTPQGDGWNGCSGASSHDGDLSDILILTPRELLFQLEARKGDGLMRWAEARVKQRKPALVWFYYRNNKMTWIEVDLFWLLGCDLHVKNKITYGGFRGKQS